MLFDGNTTDDVIQTRTKRPSFEPAMELSVGYRNHKSAEGRFYVMTGLSDRVVVNLAASDRKQFDGYSLSLTTRNARAFEAAMTAHC